MERNRMRVLACATQGSGGDDENRIRAILNAFDVTLFDFKKREKLACALELLKLLRSRQFDLFVLEGTGIAGGIAAILGRIFWGMPYIVSNGDAVAPFLSARHPYGSAIFSIYEKLLCSRSSGFIGWTPYLVGRALTFGALRAITIPGWAPYTPGNSVLQDARRAIRERYRIPEEAVVFGLVGSLNWSKGFQYCYGAELVRAARLAQTGAYVLVVGDGSGLDKLRELAGDALGSTILLPGRVSRDEVPGYLAAMDVGSIPQSVNAVGSFRYTTKLSEYRAAGLPFVTNQIPMSYDLDDGGIWRLPGTSPWDITFVHALSQLMTTLTRNQIADRMKNISGDTQFDRQAQIERATAFVTDIGRAL